MTKHLETFFRYAPALFGAVWLAIAIQFSYHDAKAVQESEKDAEFWKAIAASNRKQLEEALDLNRRLVNLVTNLSQRQVEQIYGKPFTTNALHYQTFPGGYYITK